MTFLIFIMTCIICTKLNIIPTEGTFMGLIIFGFLCWIVHCYLYIAPNADKFISKSNKEQENNSAEK